MEQTQSVQTQSTETQKSNTVTMTYPLPRHITIKQGIGIAGSLKDLCLSAEVKHQVLHVVVLRGTSASQVLNIGVLIGQLMSM